MTTPSPPPVGGIRMFSSPSTQTSCPRLRGKRKPFSGPRSSKAMKTKVCGSSSSILSPSGISFHFLPPSDLSLKRQYHLMTCAMSAFLPICRSALVMLSWFYEISQTSRDKSYRCPLTFTQSSTTALTLGCNPGLSRAWYQNATSE